MRGAGYLMPHTKDELLEIEAFFSKDPECVPLARKLFTALFARYPEAQLKISKSQAALYEPGPFCMVWLPEHGGFRHRTPHCLALTFGLGERLENSRIEQTVEPYPNRWTHHLLLHDSADLDEELFCWINRSRAFKQECLRRRRKQPADKN